MRRNLEIYQNLNYITLDFETLLTFHQLMFWKDAIFKFVVLLGKIGELKLENFRNVDIYLLKKI